MEHGQSYSLPTTTARAKLSQIIILVQDPRSCVILTRHGKPVAAVVSMGELERIWASHDIEDIVEHGKRPVSFRFGKDGAVTQHEAAERVQQVQLDRRAEREVLAGQGLEPIPGGELAAETTMQVERKRRWWEFWR